MSLLNSGSGVRIPPGRPKKLAENTVHLSPPMVEYT